MATLTLMRPGGRRAIQALLLALPAILALAGAGLRAAPDQPFLPRALGKRAPEAPLTRQPAAGVHVAITRGGYIVRHGSTAVGVAGSTRGGAWTRFAHGAERTTPFGRETVVVGPSTTEQFLTVQRRQGARTWRWRLRSGALTPRLNPDGSVAFTDAALAGVAIEPARIRLPGGRDVTPAGLRWSLRQRTGVWWLTLHVDDSKLPVPYVIDPAITLRGVLGANNGAGAASITESVPAGVAANDFMLALVSVHGGGSRTISAPAGWTLLRRENQGNNLADAIYYRAAGGSEPASYQWTFNASDKASGGIIAYTGVDLTNPIDTSSGGVSSANGTAVTAPSVTTSADGARLVGLFGMNKAGTFTAPAGMSERWDQASGATSSEAADATQALAGATGAKTATSNQSNAWVGQLVALNLDATPPTAPVLSVSESSGDSYVSGSTFWYRPGGAGSTFTVNATTSDAESGVLKVTFPGLSGGFSPSVDTDDAASPYSLTYTWPNGGGESGPQTVVAMDNAGNTAQSDFTVSPDPNAPVTTDNAASIGSGWKKTNQTVTLTPADGAGESGVASTYYTTDGSTPTLASTQGTSVALTSNGAYTIKYFSTDRVANQEAVETAGTQIRIDKTAPSSATLDALPGTIDDTTVLTGTGTDALSGVASIAYYYCPGSPCSPSILIGSSSTGPSYSVPWSSQPPDGTYQVLARVSDAAGNTLDSAAQTVTLDNAPVSTVDSGPANPTNSTSATFTFSADDPAATFECQLDGGGFAACSAPTTYSSLAPGSHTFQVRGIDVIGNVGQPASSTWTIDTTAPDTTITTTPSDPTSSTGASFSFSSTEPGSTFECRLDGGGFAACTSPKSYTGLSGGAHTFQVRATDPAGNTDATAASFGWTVDLTPPDTSITTGPASPTNATGATFSFTSTEGGSTFECQLDGGGFLPCSSPKSYAGLAAGSHTVDVRATDSVGNTDPSPASSTWTVDLTAPDTTITATPASPTSSTGAAFSFTSTEPGSSFECQLDGAGWSACTSPRSYSSLAQGQHTVQVRATDAAGNTDPTPDSFTWTVDTTAPNTIVDSGPSDPTGATGASFAFSSTEGGSTFECQLDGGGWAGCTTPTSYAGLAAGAHTFQVRATDAAGNTDATPASYGWTIDLSAPDTSITSQPSSPTNVTSASFSFASTKPGSTFECQLDSGGFAACTSPKLYTGLAAGSHTVDVRATDTVGNTDPTPASVTWTVDTTAPTTMVTSGPPNPTNSSAASFSFTSTEPGSTFECQLDGGGWSACTTPRSYSSLGAGVHTFQVRATDPAGNTDASPPTQTWTIDTTPPNTTVDSGPANPTASTSAPITFSSTEPGSSFECQLDGGGFATCTSPMVYGGLTGGNHTFQVRATDAAGNLDASPATFSWTIDATAPTASVDSGPASPTTATSASFTFSADEPSTFECKIDGGAFVSCSSPKAYAGLGGGVHTFQVRATDAVGNVGSPASYGWTIDLTPPDTSITAQPPDPTGASDAGFSFTSTEPGSTFECQLDGGGYGACTSPRTYSGLSSGTHTFQVRATDAVGNTDPSPAVVVWTIDATPPTATIDFGPADPTGLATADFQFSSSEPGSTFQCQLDGAGYSPCTSPASFTGLAEGLHVFRVKAIDGVGNVGLAATQTWHIDRTPPDAVIDSGPSDPTSATSATFTFSASEASSTFQCQLDGGGYSSCASPRTVSGLTPGSHTLQVKATDPLGNAGSATAFTWKIDTTAPTVGLDDPGAALRGVVNLSATASDAGGIRSVRFERSPAGAGTWTTIDTDTNPPFSASFSTGLVPDGWVDLRAVATDAAGNVSASPVATRRVDNTAPTATLAGSRIYIRKSATLTVTASDSGTGIASVAVQRAPSGTSTWSTLATLTSPPYTLPFDTNGLPDGQYDMRAVVTDAAGNVTTAGLTVVIAASGLGVQLTNPGASISGDVQLEATTNGEGALQVAFDLRRTGTQSWTPLGVDSNAPWILSLDTALLRDGLYDLRATVTDPDGVTAEDVLSAIRVDNTAPSLASSVPAQGARMTNSGTILLKADEALASVTNVRLDGTATAAARIKGATASLGVGPLRRGKHTLTGMLVDSAGHTAPFTLRFVVVAPAVSMRLAAPTRVGARVSVRVTLSATATVTARLITHTGHTRAMRRLIAHAGATKVRFSLTAPLAPGRYRVSVTATTGAATARKSVSFRVTAARHTWVILKG